MIEEGRTEENFVRDNKRTCEVKEAGLKEEMREKKKTDDDDEETVLVSFSDSLLLPLLLSSLSFPLFD